MKVITESSNCSIEFSDKNLRMFGEEFSDDFFTD